MEHTLSLIAILRDDPDFGQRFVKKVAEVKKDKETLLSNAQEYNKKFEQEIQEGTQKRQLMLTEGQARGLKEEEINWGGKFLPTVRTPILNFLYFLLREENQNADVKIESFRKEYQENNELEHGDFSQEDIDADFVYLLMKESNMTNEQKEQFTDSLNKKVGHMADDYDVEATEFKDVEEMDSVMFEQMGHDLFKKLKKLKSLSYSDNENEASLAHAKFVKLCREYKINPDKVPYTGNEIFD